MGFKHNPNLGIGTVSNISINGKTGSSITLVKSDIGLTNVPNVDTSNANNISTGVINPERLPVATKITMGCSKIGNGLNVDNEGLITSKLGIGLKYDGTYNMIPDVVNIDVTQLKNFSAIVTGSPKGFFNNTATLTTFTDGSKGDFWIFNGANGFNLGGNTFNTGDQLWIINTFSGNPVNLTANHVYVANTLSQATTTTFGTVKLGNITPLANSSTPAIGTSVATAREDHVHPILPDATATVSGKVPTPPNNTTTFFRGDATFAEIPNVVGATSSTDGTAGLVTKPIAGQQNLFLRGDGTWNAVSGGLTPVVKSADFTADVDELYLCDVSSNSITVDLSNFLTLNTDTTLYESNLSAGDYFEIYIIKGDTTQNSVTLSFTGLQIAPYNFSLNLEGQSGSDFIFDSNSYFRFTYTGDSTIGFKINSMTGSVPSDSGVIGSLLPFAGFTPPSGYFFTDGASKSRADYEALFNILTFSITGTLTTGTKNVTTGSTSGLYIGERVEATGVANGTIVTSITDSMNFVISNNATITGSTSILVLPYGSLTSTTFKLPDSRGKILVMPDGTTEFKAVGMTGGEKSHVLVSNEMPVHSHSYYDRGNGAINRGDWGGSTDVADNTGGTYNTGNAGGGLAHNNLQPYLNVNYIIKY